MSHHLGVPFVKSVALKDNGKIVIKGKALAGASRFNIWLQKGAASEPENVVFVYDARFNFGSDKNLIVCNNRKGGSWGSEERNANSFPFVVGEKFKMKIKINHDQYQPSGHTCKRSTPYRKVHVFRHVFDSLPTHYSVVHKFALMNNIDIT